MRPHNWEKARFAIQMTDKGAVVVTDPHQMQIYDMLEGAQKRPSILASELGMPSSSLHFILEKMVEKDIIVRCRQSPGKKTVTYSTCSDTVFIGYNPFEDVPDIQTSCSMGYLMKVYLKSIGIDALVMEKWYSEAVAESKVRFISQCKFEEAIVIAKRILNEATGFKVNVYSVSPLTVIIDGDESLKGFLNMMLYTFSAIIRRLSGTNLCAEPKEEHQIDGMTRFKTVFEPSEEPSSCRTIRRNGDMQRFAILEKDRWTKVLTNGIQIDVLKFISECPVSMQEIISCFDVPRSTLSYNIGKMMEDGLLEFRVDENGIGRYHSNYHIFLMTSTSPKRYSGIEAITEKYGFMDGYLRFVASQVENMGFDASVMMESIGQFSKEAYDKDIADLFAERLGITTEVIGRNPLMIRISGDDDDPVRSVIKGMVCRKVRSMYGDSLGVYSADGVLTFTDAGQAIGRMTSGKGSQGMGGSINSTYPDQPF